MTTLATSGAGSNFIFKHPKTVITAGEAVGGVVGGGLVLGTAYEVGKKIQNKYFSQKNVLKNSNAESQNVMKNSNPKSQNVMKNSNSDGRGVDERANERVIDRTGTSIDVGDMRRKFEEFEKFQNKLKKSGHIDAANVPEMLDSNEINETDFVKAVQASQGTNPIGKFPQESLNSEFERVELGNAPTESACTFDQMVESLGVIACPEACTRPQLCNLIPSCP